jgi:hypothetical protein
MKRIKGSRAMEAYEMKALARALERAGFDKAAVGIDYIDFYEDIEIWEVTNGVLNNQI